MYIVSNAFAAAMRERPYIARITLDGLDIIQGDPIQEINFRGGANGDKSAFTLGSTVSASVEMVLNKEKVTCQLQGREVQVELGMELGEITEWIPMGIYYITEPLADDDQLTVKAYDALAAKFECEYEPIVGFDFGTGVSSVSFLQALCARRGVTVDASTLAPIQLKASPEGFTERQIIGFIAALYGGFASVDRTGILRIRSYSECDASVTADNYYEGGMEKADYSFSVQWLKCYNEIHDVTMFVGDSTAEQGIYLESIWMNYTILNELWGKLQGFTYRPVTELSFLGNPLIDAGDIILFEDLAGERIKVPVMSIVHEYDGGIITRVTAHGQAKSDGHAGTAKREVQRAVNHAKKYTDELDEALNQLEVLKRLTAAGTDDAIYLQDGKLAIKATAILTGVLDATLIGTGVITSSDGSIRIDLTNNKIEFITTSRSNPCKFEFDPYWGLVGYGYDATTGELVRTLRIDPGEKTEPGVTKHTMVSTFDGMGLGVMGGDTTIGSSGTETEIVGASIKLGYKTVSWKSNGDGTYTLIGR